MAKVMISIPDEQLERLDARARELGESRSGLLQRLVERELEASATVRRQEIEELLAEIRELGPGENARIDAAQMIREDRESH